MLRKELNLNQILVLEILSKFYDHYLSSKLAWNDFKNSTQYVGGYEAELLLQEMQGSPEFLKYIFETIGDGLKQKDPHAENAADLFDHLLKDGIYNNSVIKAFESDFMDIVLNRKPLKNYLNSALEAYKQKQDRIEANTQAIFKMLENSKRSEFFDACCDNDVNTVINILDSNASIYGHNHIDTAVLFDSHDVLKLLLERRIYSPDDLKEALISAAGNNNIPALTMLLSLEGSTPNMTVDSNQTPLMVAAGLGNYEACQLLLGSNADPSPKHKIFNMTAFECAKEHGYSNILKLFDQKVSKISMFTQVDSVEFCENTLTPLQSSLLQGFNK